MRIKDTTYDTLKYIAQYVLPGLGTLYFALAAIWGLPYGEQVVGTITALDAFLGLLLGISTSAYRKEDHTDGVMVVTAKDENTDLYSMQLNTDPSELKDKSTVSFKVDKSAAATTAKKVTTKKTASK